MLVLTTKAVLVRVRLLKEFLWMLVLDFIVLLDFLGFSVVELIYVFDLTI